MNYGFLLTTVLLSSACFSLRILKFGTPCLSYSSLHKFNTVLHFKAELDTHTSGAISRQNFEVSVVFQVPAAGAESWNRETVRLGWVNMII